MNFALSKKDKCLLIGVAGVLFLVIIWFYVVSPLKEKTAVLETENVALKSKSEMYLAINANLSRYEQEIDDMKSEIAAISAAYPVQISRQDEIMFLANMENTYYTDLAVENITMSVVEEVYAETPADTAQVTAEAADEAATADATAEEQVVVPEIHLYRQPVNYTFRCTYKGVKDMLNYLFTQTNKKGVEGLSLAFDSETGNLRGSLDLNQFYMIGIDKDYQAIPIPAIPKGVDDVFHTVNGAEGVNAVYENAEQEERTE